ncbi:MAG: hypothetical protein EOO90_16965 [Pedobacter sp.]|nr:MAG: hypothetical protein EOO90_16965 [Pedobacter sp.]
MLSIVLIGVHELGLASVTNFPAWQWIWNPIEDNGYTDPYGGGGGGGGGSKDKVNQLKEVVIKGKRRGAIGGPIPWYGNFLGPGPDANPYNILGYDGKKLKPINMLDAAAQRHDAAYDRAKVGGVKGALFSVKVSNADMELAVGSIGVIAAFTKDQMIRSLDKKSQLNN